MKNEIKNDLEELVSLIESEEDFAKLIHQFKTQLIV